MADRFGLGWMHVSVIGELVDDPVLTYSPGGQPKTVMHILVQYRKKTGYEGASSRLTRIVLDVTVGAKGAEVAVKYGRKGGWIFVGRGRIVKRGGRYAVAADQFHFLPGAPTAERTIYTATKPVSGRGGGRWSGAGPREIRPRKK